MFHDGADDSRAHSPDHRDSDQEAYAVSVGLIHLSDESAGVLLAPFDPGDVANFQQSAALGVPIVDLDWQISVGGLVWSLKALRWVLEEGIHVVPESITWIDELLDRALNLTKILANDDEVGSLIRKREPLD